MTIAHSSPPALAIALLCCLGHAQTRQPLPAGHLSFDATRGELSVTGGSAPLSRLLQELAGEHGVHVRVADFHDRVVDVEFGPRPLADALALLLGSDARYHLDTGNRDLAVAAPTPPTVRQVGDVRQGNGRAMDVVAVPTAGLSPMRLPQSGGAGSGLMAAAESIAGGAGAGQPDAPAVIASTHACIVLVMRADSTAAIDRIVELDGPAVAPTTLQGDYLYEVTIGGELFAVGSLQDPLRNYPVCTNVPADPRRQMTRPTDDAARVVLTVDVSPLEPANLRRANLRLHRLTDAAGLPSELTAATYAAFRAKAAPAFAVDAPAIANALIERR